MAQPSVVSSNPVASAVDVFLNVPLTVTFNTPGLEPSSVSVNSCMLVNIATQQSVSIELSYNSSTRVLTITPLSTLAEDTVYKIRFPGTDIALSSDYVIKESGTLTALSTTIDITFTSGSRVYLDDSVIAKDATDLSLEGDINLPWNVKAIGTLSVESTNPKNHKADVPTSLDGNNRIEIKFNKPISGALLEQDWLDVIAYPILDYTGYLASSGVFGAGTIPTMTGLTYSGNYIYANFDGPMPNNVGVKVSLAESITATDTTEVGPNDFRLSFTTDRFPKVGGVNILKTELAAAADSLYDDYIASLLLKNTVQIIFRWSPFSQEQPQYLAYKYIVNKTILDILDDKDLEKALVAGTSRTLGDMTISIDNLMGQLALKAKRAEKEVAAADDGMQGIKKLGQRLNQAIYVDYRADRLWYGINNNLVDFRFRYYQPNVPAANSVLNRQSKIQNPWYI